MSLFNRRPPAHRKKVLQLPDEWLPGMKRVDGIINHWTGGSHTASSLDKEHYHFLIEGDPAKVVRGHHSIAANVPPLQSSDDYAAHTRGANSYRIGNSICAMAGGQERPVNYGRYPISQEQWDLLVLLNAAQCRHYALPVNVGTVLLHGEVQSSLGIWQRGKWDIGVLKFAGMKTSDCREVGNRLRKEVQEAL